MRDMKIRTAVASAIVAVMLLLSLLSVALAAGPTADASRTIDPKVVQLGEQVGITVVFQNLLNVSKAFALKEVIPAGWGFTRGTDDADQFKNSTKEWVWFTVGAGANKTVTYNLTVPIGAALGDYVINGTVTGNGTENLVGGDTTITVTVLYDLTMAVAPGGSGTATDLTGASPYTAATVVNIQAVAAAGYRFLNWSAPAGTFGNATAATTTFTMPAQNVTVTANFVTVYSLTMAVSPGGSGTATDLTGASPYKANTVVNIQAAAAAGYRFLNWSAPAGTFGNATAATTTFTMPVQNVTVTANFGLVPPPVSPTVTTQAATGITTSSATLNMQYTVGGYSSVEVRFAYKKSTDSTWSYTAWVSKAASGTYAAPLSGLTSSTKYDFKAQLKYDSTVIEGTTLQFTTSTLPPSGGGCFIATAAYGTPTAKQIDVLREFRDVVLLKSTLGSRFVALYYQFSPPVADSIAGHELLRTLVRELLVDPIVWMVQLTGDMWRN